jgi:hypothetical protein
MIRTGGGRKPFQIYGMLVFGFNFYKINIKKLIIFCTFRKEAKTGT